jgi:hypothetical protein
MEETKAVLKAEQKEMKARWRNRAYRAKWRGTEEHNQELMLATHDPKNHTKFAE